MRLVSSMGLICSLSPPGLWQKLGGDKEAQGAFDAKGGSANMQGVKTLLTTNNMKFTQVPGVDKTPLSVTAVGLFTTATVGGNGKPVTVGTMVRCETNQQQQKYRLTVRTAAASLSQV